MTVISSREPRNDLSDVIPWIEDHLKQNGGNHLSLVDVQEKVKIIYRNINLIIASLAESLMKEALKKGSTVTRFARMGSEALLLSEQEINLVCRIAAHVLNLNVTPMKSSVTIGRSTSSPLLKDTLPTE